MFRGDKFFLSNFYPCVFDYAGRTWKSSEHAYAASKTSSASEYETIANAETAKVAKRMGRLSRDGGIVCHPVDKWSSKRLGVMRSILDEKFKIPELRDMLLNTGSDPLVELNYWNDTFWGVDINTGIGENNLGKILMSIRLDIELFS